MLVKYYEYCLGYVLVVELSQMECESDMYLVAT